MNILKISKKLPFIFLSIFFLPVLFSCDKVQTPPNKIKTADTTATYKVVAHRGGSAECNEPDCSVASLMYAISLKCYASECDITLTKDNYIVIAHTTDGNRVNGLVPYEHTLAEIRANGTLTNGEKVPILEDFLNILKDKTQNPYGMKIWLDVKRLYNSSGTEIDVNHSINACLRASEIIQQNGACNYCEFLIPTGTSIFDQVKNKVVDDYHINLAWMTCTNPSKYGNAWAQIAYAKLFTTGSAYSPYDYISEGVPLSIYNVDDDTAMENVIPYYPKLKAIFTNYPSVLIKKLIDEGYAK